MKLRFGEYVLDASRGELCREDVVLKLQPQPLRVLQILLEHAPELVTRELLAAHIWGSTVHVDQEQSLNFCIRQIRSALADSASRPRFLETLPKQGYRFIAAVTRDGEVPSPAPATQPAGEVSPEAAAVAARSSNLSRRRVLWLGGAALLGGGGHWLARELRRPAKDRAVDVVVPLPSGTAAADPGHILGAPVVSPDGTTVIVALSTGEFSSLFIRRLESDQLMHIEGTHGAVQPFWSPDSQHIGFFAAGMLKRMAISGGEATTLCEVAGPRGGCWGRSGVILFGMNFKGLSQVPATGGRATPVTELDGVAGENSHRNPVFLPDGTRFLYLARTDDPEKRAIYLDTLRPQKSSERQHVGSADYGFALGRDPGENVWYLLSQHAGRIVAQPFDVRRGTLTGAPFPLLKRAGTLSASDTGVLVLRTEQQMRTRLLWLDRKGAPLGMVGDADDYWSVTLSPDDRWLTAVRHNSLTGQFKIWLAETANGLLEPMSASDHAPCSCWSPDSRAVYYTDIRSRQLIRHEPGNTGAGKVVMLLEKEPEVLVDSVSPAHEYVVGERDVGGSRYQLSLSALTQTPQWRPLPANGPLGLRARLSPDGNWLATASSDTGDSEIYVMRFPGGSDRRRLSVAGGTQPCWRHDGRELFYVAGDGGMMVISFDTRHGLGTSAPTKLFSTSLRLGSDRPLYAVTGDGHRFLVIDGANEAGGINVELVLHWPSLLRVERS